MHEESILEFNQHKTLGKKDDNEVGDETDATVYYEDISETAIWSILEEEEVIIILVVQDVEI